MSRYAQDLVNRAFEAAAAEMSVSLATSEPSVICPSVYTTGVMGSEIPEQSLVLCTEAGLVVITGCGHPGVVNIVNRARNLWGHDVLLVLGGFHLDGKEEGEIRRVVTELSGITRYVGPCHCSGSRARELFEHELKNRYVEIGAGSKVVLSELVAAEDQQ